MQRSPRLLSRLAGLPLIALTGLASARDASPPAEQQAPEVAPGFRIERVQLPALEGRLSALAVLPSGALALGLAPLGGGPAARSVARLVVLEAPLDGGLDFRGAPAARELGRLDELLALRADGAGLLALGAERLLRIPLEDPGGVDAARVLWTAQRERAIGGLDRALDGRIAFALDSAGGSVVTLLDGRLSRMGANGLGARAQLAFDARGELLACAGAGAGSASGMRVLQALPGCGSSWREGLLTLEESAAGAPGALLFQLEDPWPEVTRGALLRSDPERGLVSLSSLVPRGASQHFLAARELCWRASSSFRPTQLQFDAPGRRLFVLDAGESASGGARLWCLEPSDAPRASQPAPPLDGAGWVEALESPSFRLRLSAQACAAAGAEASLDALERVLLGGEGGYGEARSDRARRHAIWALDAALRAATAATAATESYAAAPQPGWCARAERLLQRCLELDLPEVKLQALRALARRAGSLDARRLAPLLGFPVPAVAREAAEAAGRLGLSDCAGALCDALSEAGDMGLIASLRWALGETAGFSRAALRMRSLVDVERRALFWQLFADHPGAPAREAVAALLADPTTPYRVRVEAVEQLADFARGAADAQARAALEAAVGDRAPAVRAAVSAALARLAEGAAQSTPLRVPQPGPAGESELFRALDAARTGLDFESDFDWQHPLRHLYQHGWAGGGAAVADVDGDGLPELFLTSQTGTNRLYHNLGDLHFEDITQAAGLAGAARWSAGASFADLNGDGRPDLLVCNYDAPNEVWINLGARRFEERAAELGLDYSGASVQLASADYDRDGDLDLFLLTNRLYPGGGLDEPRMQPGGRAGTGLAPGQEDRFALQLRLEGGGMQTYVVKAGERDRLYRNDGAAGFHDVSESAGLFGHHPGLAVLWFDFDQDGLPDLFVGNDFWDPDFLYRNLGDGRFEDVKFDRLPHTPWFTMGADACDVNRDGRIDFMAADMAPTTHFMSKLMMGEMGDSRWFLESAVPRQYMRNALYLNSGATPFEEAGFLTGLAQSDWTWSILFGDLDLDGSEDLFVTNGSANHSFDPDLNARMAALALDQNRRGVTDPAQRYAEAWELYREVEPRPEWNLAFRNAGELAFESVGQRWGLAQESLSFGAALADLDRDGDLDVVVQNVGRPLSLFENLSTKRGRLLVSLEGVASPSQGIGAELRLEIEGQPVQLRQLYTARGYLSCAEPVAHFGGLADAPAGAPIRLLVRWPSGSTSLVRDIAPDSWLHLREAESQPPSEAPAALEPLFAALPGAGGLAIGGRPEFPYDDYARQPLLPARLSTPGPGLACADFDGDGDEDLLLGGARGQSALLFVNQSAGSGARESGFRVVTELGAEPLAWAAERGSEDTAVLWLDADGDGRLDLFVGSGGVEQEPGDESYRDRLYLQRADGRFERAFDALPDLRDSTQCACAADLDGDGDLDLFVGSRSIPGRYPESPASHLLRNEGGRFVEVTRELAAGLLSGGLVTSATWSDVDGDARPDLLIAREWDSIALWMNGEAGFVEAGQAAGLAQRRGWWSSIVAADFDADGRIDFALGNAGLNHKYAGKQPLALYYGALEQGSGMHLVEAERGRLPDGSACVWPTRGLSCSSGAMPTIRERMPSFRDFAAATLEEIYDPNALRQALVLEANHLESGVLLNRSQAGRPSFEYASLPRHAQIAPVQGMAVADWTGDGRLDLVLAQNFFGREPETGHWDGGVGLLLEGDGAGGFRVVDAGESGIAAQGEARALLCMDLDGRGLPELVMSRQGEQLLAWSASGAAGLRVELSGRPGNPTCVGARVRWVAGEQTGSLCEVRAGSGYLSQSSARVWLSSPPEGARLELRWPDGSLSEVPVPPGASSLRVAW